MAGSEIVWVRHNELVGDDSEARDQEVGTDEIKGASKGEEGRAELVALETSLPQQEGEAWATAKVGRTSHSSPIYPALVPKILQQGQRSVKNQGIPSQ